MARWVNLPICFSKFPWPRIPHIKDLTHFDKFLALLQSADNFGKKRFKPREKDSIRAVAESDPNDGWRRRISETF
jgi:hypothetical protein